MDDELRAAWCIKIGELEGNEWDWAALRWRERK
jgi:hypothetical protein